MATNNAKKQRSAIFPDCPELAPKWLSHWETPGSAHDLAPNCNLFFARNWYWARKVVKFQTYMLGTKKPLLCYISVAYSGFLNLLLLKCSARQPFCCPGRCSSTTASFPSAPCRLMGMGIVGSGQCLKGYLCNVLMCFVAKRWEPWYLRKDISWRWCRLNLSMSVSMSVGRKYRLIFQENARHVDNAPWRSRTTDSGDLLLPLRDASWDRLLKLTQSPNDPNSSSLLGSL